MAKSKASTKAKISAPRRNSRPNRRKPMSPEPTTKGSAANPAPTASAGSPERAAASVRYVDRADMVETFADSVTGLIFDGQTLRIAAGRGRRSHQSHATDRGSADASRRGESSAAASSIAAKGRLIGISNN
jgi:hypothetical protein